MSDLKNNLARYSSEYLVEMRGRGDELLEETHRVIEEILTERSERIPPRPARAIRPDSSRANEKSPASLVASLLFTAIALLGLSISHQIGKTWVGILVCLVIASVWIANEIRRGKLPAEERAREDNDAEAARLGLTDLMRASADGDLQRVQELLAYGHDPNGRSDSGGTPLMLAALNNRLEVAMALIVAGADPRTKSRLGQTAMAIAERAGHAEMATYLRSKALG